LPQLRCSGPCAPPPALATECDPTPCLPPQRVECSFAREHASPGRPRRLRRRTERQQPQTPITGRAARAASAGAGGHSQACPFRRAPAMHARLASRLTLPNTLSFFSALATSSSASCSAIATSPAAAEQRALQLPARPTPAPACPAPLEALRERAHALQDSPTPPYASDGCA
jgi:hypothetical protein